MFSRQPIYLCAVAAATVTVYCTAQISTTSATGLYTAVQAKRGEQTYKTTCAMCHGLHLEGNGPAPSLKGDDFWGEYDEKPVEVLFNKIQKTMPGEAPGSLDPKDTADIIAFLLGNSRYPAGSAELPSNDDSLKKINLPKPPSQ